MTNPAVSPIGTHSLALIFGGVGCASKLRASGTKPTTTALIRSRQKILFKRFSQCQHLNRNTVSGPIKYSSWSLTYTAWLHLCPWGGCGIPPPRHLRAVTAYVRRLSTRVAPAVPVPSTGVTDGGLGTVDWQTEALS